MAFHLVRLSVLNFRNHGEIGVDLGPEVNCFTGPNGTGKTNLLDAVHYLALGKSYFDPVDQHNVRLGEELFVLQGTMAVGEEEDVIRVPSRAFGRSRPQPQGDPPPCGSRRPYPVVMTPYDGQIVQVGSEVRRRFLDGLIAQFDKGYLEALIRYNRALMQRNALLKRLAEAIRTGSDIL